MKNNNLEIFCQRFCLFTYNISRKALKKETGKSKKKLLTLKWPHRYG